MAPREGSQLHGLATPAPPPIRAVYGGAGYWEGGDKVNHYAGKCTTEGDGG